MLFFGTPEGGVCGYLGYPRVRESGTLTECPRPVSTGPAIRPCDLRSDTESGGCDKFHGRQSQSNPNLVYYTPHRVNRT